MCWTARLPQPSQPRIDLEDPTAPSDVLVGMVYDHVNKTLLGTPSPPTAETGRERNARRRETAQSSQWSCCTRAEDRRAAGRDRVGAAPVRETPCRPVRETPCRPPSTLPPPCVAATDAALFRWCTRPFWTGLTRPTGSSAPPRPSEVLKALKALKAPLPRCPCPPSLAFCDAVSFLDLPLPFPCPSSAFP